jgi:hypothetical protein
MPEEGPGPEKDPAFAAFYAQRQQLREQQERAKQQTEQPQTKNPEPPIPFPGQKKTRRGQMNLPSVLIEEAARIIFEYWENNHPTGRQPVAWDRLHPKYRAMWCDITRVVLEMGITVVLNDATQFLDHTNGDMGGAFAKALKRYRQERLES